MLRLTPALCLVAVCLGSAAATAGRSPSQGRIVGGLESWMGLEVMVKLERQQANLCGGSVLNPRWAVTLASCVHIFKSPVEVLSLFTGQSSRLGADPARKYYLSEVVIHEKFNPNALLYDFALLKVRRPFTNVRSEVPISTSPAPVDHLMHPAGWSAPHPGADLQAESHVANMIVQDNSVCWQYYSAHGGVPLPHPGLCLLPAYPEDGDTCVGDWGSAVFDGSLLYGLVSYHVACLGSTDLVPTVANDITAVRDWAMEHISN